MFDWVLNKFFTSFAGSFYILLGKELLTRKKIGGIMELISNFYKYLVKHCGANYRLYQKKSLYDFLNPLQPGVSFAYPLKRSENL